MSRRKSSKSSKSKSSKSPLPRDGKLTTEEMAAELGVTRRTLARWNEAGCPHEGGGPGRPIYYDKAAVIAWMEATGATGTPGRPPQGAERKGGTEDDGLGEVPSDVSKIAVLTRKVNLAIKMQELKKRARLERIAIGELHDRGECERGRLERIAAVKAGLLALPGKLAARLENREAAEIQRELDREVRHLLAQFAGQS